MSTSIFSNVGWGSGPNMKVSASYDYRRSGADMQYKITVSIAPVTGASYFGYSIQWYTNVNGSGYVSQGTLKNASPSQWSSAITATTDWITVSNKTSGSTSFALKVTSSGSTGSGRAAGEYTGYNLYVSPAASTMTVTSGTYIGNSWSFNISRNDSTFKHKITWSCGGSSGYILGNSSTMSTSTSTTWTPSVSTFGPILIDSTSKGITFYLYTYDSSGNSIGSKSYSATIYVPSYTPSASNFTVSVYNDNTIVNSWGVALQGYSKYNYSFTPSYNYGAQVKSYSISNMAGASASRSGTWSSGTISNRTGVVNNYGTFTPKLQYTDSRGKKCSSTSPSSSSIYVYEYFKPQLKNVIASRCDSTGLVSEVGDHIKIACNPVFATVTVNGEDKNSVTTTYTVKQISDGTVLVDREELDDIGVVIPTVDQSFTIELDESYQVTITTIDALGNPYTADYMVKVATTTLHLKDGGHGVGIGRYCNEDNKFQVGWDTEIDGGLDCDYLIRDHIPANSNLDNYWQTGHYRCSSNVSVESLINCPTSYAFTMDVWGSTGVGRYTEESTYVYLTQRIMDYKGNIYQRNGESGSGTIINWSEWHVLFSPAVRTSTQHFNCTTNFGVKATFTLPAGYKIVTVYQVYNHSRPKELGVSFGQNKYVQAYTNCSDCTATVTPLSLTSYTSGTTMYVWASSDTNSSTLQNGIYCDYQVIG